MKYGTFRYDTIEVENGLNYDSGESIFKTFYMYLVIIYLEGQLICGKLSLGTNRHQDSSSQ